MTSGGNNFNSLPENQLTKFNAVETLRKCEGLFYVSAVQFCRTISFSHRRYSIDMDVKIPNNCLVIFNEHEPDSTIFRKSL